MTDQDKTREQLLEEVQALRQRLARLEEGEAERRRSEERFAAVFHASPVAISLTTLADGRFVDVNDSWLRLFGFRREDVIGRTTTELGIWPDPAYRPALLETLRRRRSIRDQEETFRAGSGELRHVLVSVELLDVAGGPHLLAMLLDITERQRAERALRASEERFRQLAENIREVFWIADARAGRVLYVSPAYEAVWGRPCAELYDRPGSWLEAVPPDDRGRVRAAQEEVVRGGTCAVEYRVVRPDGSVRWVWDRASAVRGADGVVERLVGIVEDITERKRAEELLRESEGRLRGFFEAAFEGLVFHEGGVIVDANQRFADLFGYPLEEVIGKSVLELGAPESHDEVRRHIATGDEGPYEAVGRRKDGSTFPGELRGRPVTYRGRPARVTAVRDITQRKRDERRLREYAGRLQALSRRLLEVQEQERRALARELHDEIGQVLTGLKLGLERGAPLAAGAVRQALEEAQGLVKDLAGRVRDLSLRLRPTMLDDLGLRPALVWHFERYTAQTRVRVTFEHGPLPGRFPPAVETAAYRIVQEALTNVARHAKVTDAVVRLWADADALGVQVEDRGAGFDPRRAAGTSGGLSGMQERARLLGGRLDVESAPGRGTRVTAELPLGGNGEAAADFF